MAAILFFKMAAIFAINMQYFFHYISSQFDSLGSVLAVYGLNCSY